MASSRAAWKAASLREGRGGSVSPQGSLTAAERGLEHHKLEISLGELGGFLR